MATVETTLAKIESHLYRLEAKINEHGEHLAVLRADRESRRGNLLALWGALVTTWGGLLGWLLTHGGNASK